MITHGREKLLLPRVPDIEQAARQLAALRDPRTLALYERLLVDPEIHSRQEILQWAKETYGWKTPTTRWYLATLEQAGLLKATKSLGDQRRIAYRPLAADPVILKAANKNQQNMRQVNTFSSIVARTKSL